MNIIVCIKQVPGTADVKIDPVDNTLIREDVPNIINPFDLYAIEEGLRLKESFGGKVTVISMGPPQAADALKEALSMGADEAVLLADRAFAGSDSWATAYTLSRAIQVIGAFDIILCGRQAIDGDTGQVGPGLARQLGITQLTYVFKIRKVDPPGKIIMVDRLLEEGHEIVEAVLPALLTVVKDINQPRSPSLADIRRAAKLKIRLMTATDLTGVDRTRLGLDGSPTKVIKIFNPPRREGILDMIRADTAEEAAAQLADKILSEKII
ncbi:MAG: electron transfer flavoprotein subunit beta [Deltaproteobacteria bacterium HGW-Deltaproteobacteria-13]|jgi:electron transfer flavoprotein beta subunit|nr:MAG: electron transfer flavoprotein subunit beta [Deltaproteobacteria bacterium HGW-Deltaproteobacteria-13]